MNGSAKSLTTLARAALRGLAVSVGLLAAATAFIAVVPGADRVANISLLYLIVVIAVALSCGSAHAIVVSFLAVLTFDWFFVSPRHTFTISDPSGWLALFVFLATATIIGGLTANLRERAEEARQRERETSALAAVSWTVAAHLDPRRALEEILQSLADTLDITAAAIFGAGSGSGSGGGAMPEVLAVYPPTITNGPMGKVEWVDSDVLAFFSADDAHGNDPSVARVRYTPLVVDDRTVGVLCLDRRGSGNGPGQLSMPIPAPSLAEERVFSSLCNLAAVCLERQRLLGVEAETRAVAQADRLKTSLLAMVSHDFRSPLASIKASVTGLLQTGEPWDEATQTELLSGINQETDRLNRMVGNILALSRLESGDWQPQREATTVTEMMGSVLDSFSVRDNARIRLLLEGDLPDLWLDSVQIGQVLHNLIENALKYSTAGEGVKVHAERAGDALWLEVLDRGCGLDEGEEARVFSRFYRSPRWRESALPGSGLGLAICSGLVEAHGGTIEAANREGGGAIFRVQLPRVFEGQYR